MLTHESPRRLEHRFLIKIVHFVWPDISVNITFQLEVLSLVRRELAYLQFYH